MNRMSRNRIVISCIIIVLAVVGWRILALPAISPKKAKAIAAQALMGVSRPPSHVPVRVEDRDQAYAVYFTFPVPGGRAGETYKSYAVVDKTNGEVLEIGVMPPGE